MRNKRNIIKKIAFTTIAIAMCLTACTNNNVEVSKMENTDTIIIEETSTIESTTEESSTDSNAEIEKLNMEPLEALAESVKDGINLAGEDVYFKDGEYQGEDAAASQAPLMEASGELIGLTKEEEQAIIDEILAEVLGDTTGGNTTPTPPAPAPSTGTSGYGEVMSDELQDPVDYGAIDTSDLSTTVVVY